MKINHVLFAKHLSNCLSKLTPDGLVAETVEPPSFAVDSAIHSRHLVPALVPRDVAKLTQKHLKPKITSVSAPSLYPPQPLLSSNSTATHMRHRELVSERMRSLSTSSTAQDEDEDVDDGDVEASVAAFKTSIDCILAMAEKVTKGSKSHNRLRVEVGPFIERLIDALDLELPQRLNTGGGGVGAQIVTTGIDEGVTSVSVASQFAATLPDDPAAQIEAFRIILNQLKLRDKKAISVDKYCRKLFCEIMQWLMFICFRFSF